MTETNCWNVLTRRKSLPCGPQSVPASPGTGGGGVGTGHGAHLGRVLNTFDLTALGVGATLGVGVYVLAGHVSRDLAGPSVVLSFLIAAVASFMAGLCYAEFGARVPKAGSAYYYSYVCIGELVAFVTGWNLILQYVIGSASISRGMSLYLDTMLNDTLKKTFREIAPMQSTAFASHFDFLAFGMPLILAVALAFGLKKSAIMNNIFTAVNIAIVLFVIVCGAIKADIANWQIIPTNATAAAGYVVGEGGFFPFGIEGMIKGAATCFFGFVGFDCIATTGEEVKNPHRAIPRAILFSLITIFLSYFGVSTVLTLMWPYYLQDINAPLPYAFDQIGWYVAKWVVAIGGVVGLLTSLFGAMFPLPRIIYAMSVDGLIFKFLGRVNETFKTPVVGTLASGLLTGLVAAIFDLKQLVNMLSIGTLLAYTVVAISITILRFSDHHMPYLEVHSSENMIKAKKDTVLNQLFSCNNKPSRPNRASKRIVVIAVFAFSITSLALGLLILNSRIQLAAGELWAIISWSVLVAIMIMLLLIIAMQPKEESDRRVFHVPFVPLIPGISIFVNIYLMLMLDLYTWIFFAVWLAIGLTIYNICTFVLNKHAHDKDAVVDARNSFTSLAIDQNGVGPHKNGITKEMPVATVAAAATVSVAESDQKKSTPPTVRKTNGPQSVSPQLISHNEQQQHHRVEVVVNERVLEDGEKQQKSPNFDEIVMESEVMGTHIEKREANGKAYFIERSNTEDVLQMLDNAIADNEAEEMVAASVEEQLDDARDIDGDGTEDGEIEAAIETVAMIHKEGEPSGDIVKEQDEKEETCPISDQLHRHEDSDSGILLASQNSLNEPQKQSMESIGIGMKEDVVQPPIPPPLPPMSGTKTLPLQRNTSKNKEMDPIHTVGPIKSSRSDTDLRSLLFEEIKRFRKEDADDIPEIVEAVSPTIPDAPTFDPAQYEQTATLPRSPVTPKSSKRKAPSPPAPPKRKESIISSDHDPAHSNADSVSEGDGQDPNDVTITKKSIAAKMAFKNQLERIYSRGPPVVPPKPPKPVAPAVDSVPNTPTSNSADEIFADNSPLTKTELSSPQSEMNISDISGSNPFDTVHKQKALFNDVLKAIHPDTRPSIIRNDSFQKHRSDSTSPPPPPPQ